MFKKFDWGWEFVNFFGMVHNENGPAFMNLVGYKSWLINGYWHRIDGPARLWDKSHPFFNDPQFYLEGRFYNAKLWSRETGHLICLNCNNFCNQNCF